MQPEGRRRECGSGAQQHLQARAEGIAHTLVVIPFSDTGVGWGLQCRAHFDA
jgi:hypothetical protein